MLRLAQNSKVNLIFRGGPELLSLTGKVAESGHCLHVFSKCTGRFFSARSLLGERSANRVRPQARWTSNRLALKGSIKGATLHAAVALLTDRGISAAPVIDEGVRPESRGHGVHDREAGFHIATSDLTRVRDLITPALFSIAPDARHQAGGRGHDGAKYHRLFVVGADGVLTGVISAFDVLQHLHPEHSLVPDPVAASVCNNPNYGYEPW